ncbi:beta strand repeat-containing protein [Undibacterium sp. Di24W]|uniref:beta strand repeat-containing protein n=1 Tax=Undibacterium sp. Di24W TaxID=3413033 RepID=UPI003BEF787E
MMKYIRAVLAITTFALLSACGGGGGSAGNTSGKALFTTAAEKLTIVSGQVQTYNVGGGIPAYTATSNTGAITASIKGTTLTITGVGSGSATVTVTDAAGAFVKIDVIAGTGTDFFITAPETLTLGIGLTSSTFSAGGGSGIYQASSGNRQVVTVTQNGNQFYLTGVSAGKTTVVVADSGGITKKIEVTIGTGLSLFTTAASDVNVAIGAASVYTVGGGNGSYSVASSNVSVATVSITGDKLTITGKTAGNSTIVVRDATNGVVEIKVVVGSNLDLFTTAPAQIRVAIGVSSPEFTISGGNQVYSIVSGNPQVATVGINENKFIVRGVANGVTTITVKDGVGKTVTFDVVVGSIVDFYTTAPRTITIPVSGTGAYVLGGGTAPYTATSSNASLVTTSVSGSNLVISGVTGGIANVLLRDANGTVISLVVNVGNGGVNNPFYVSAPGTLNIATGASPSYLVAGGTGPYTAASSNLAIANPTIAGGTLTITGVAPGTANIVVKDALGTPVTIVVTVGTGGVAVQFYTSAPSTFNLATGASPTFLLGGGSSPYVATSSDVKVATVSVTGSVLTVTGVGPGTATLSLFDNVGAKLTVTTNVLGATSPTLIVSPIATDSYPGDVLYFRVDGGTAPYSVISTNNAIASITSGSVLASAGTITVFSAKAGKTQVVVADANGLSQTINITIAATIPQVLRFTPAAWSINETNGATIPLVISGGNGPFQVFTDTPLLSAVSGTSPDATNPLTFTGRTVNVSTGTQGNRCVAADTVVTLTVKDALNNSATSVMTIVNIPAGCP